MDKNVIEITGILRHLKGLSGVAEKLKNMAHAKILDRYMEKDCEECNKKDNCDFRKGISYVENAFKKYGGDANKAEPGEVKNVVETVDRLQDLGAIAEKVDCMKLERNRQKTIREFEDDFVTYITMMEIINDEEKPYNFSISLDTLLNTYRNNMGQEVILAKCDVDKYVDDNYHLKVTEGNPEYKERIKELVKGTIKGYFEM